MFSIPAKACHLMQTLICFPFSSKFLFRLARYIFKVDAAVFKILYKSTRLSSREWITIIDNL